MKKRLLVLGGCICLICVLAVLPFMTAYAKPLPKLITMTGFTAGTSGYAIASGVREAVDRLTPMKMRLESYGSDRARIIPLRNKESELTCQTASTLFTYNYGWFDVAKPEWGPQPIRQVWPGTMVTLSIFVRGDSDIKSAADLKGKSIGYLPGSPVLWKAEEAILAFAGLSRGDMTWKPAPSHPVGIRGVGEGKWNAYYASTGTPACRELAAGPHGIRWMQVPPENKEGWKRLKAIAPWVVPSTTTVGAGITAKNPLQALGYYYGIWAYNFVDENVVYELVKATHQGYDIYKDMHAYLKVWTLDNAVALNRYLPIPFHPGAVKYFKEIGRWTAEHEKWHAQQVRLEKERQQQFTRDPKAWEAKHGK